MRIIRHNAYIANRKTRAKLLALAGFVMLIGTLFVALLPNFLAPAYIVMLIGFVLFNLGMQQVGKWTRNPRNDQIFDNQLKTLADRYALVHYPPIGKRRAEHLLIHPGGVLIVTAKEIDGKISAIGSKWRRSNPGLRKFLTFSGPQLGNPGIETEQAVGEVEAWLTEHQLEIDVEGAVVFVHPSIELDVEAPDFPVLHGDELPQFVQSMEPDPTFTAKERARLLELLGTGEQVESPAVRARRRPVKRRAA